MNWRNIFGGFGLCAALVVLGHLYLDIRLAEFVTAKVGPEFLFSGPVSGMPDLLFLLVCIVVAVSWLGRFCLALMSIKGRGPDCLELIGWAVPLAFILKSPLKDLFGETNARVWLLRPDLFGFHWFQGGGDFASFPSGHMAVVMALMLGIGRYFPRLRTPCAGSLLLLAAALIATQYHFFSDIVAGTYLGFLADSLTGFVLSCRHARRTPANRSMI